MTLSVDKEKSETRFFAIASAVLFAIVAAIPSRAVAAVLGVLLACTAWLLLFHGTTVISLRLQDTHRTVFQVAVALAVPIALSFYFIHRTPELTAAGVTGSLRSAWILMPVAIIGYSGWIFADILNREHPFRGFLIASAVLFVICFLGYYGIYSAYDAANEESVQYIDRDAATMAQRSGRYFGQFLVYVAVVYAGMLAKLKKRNATG